MFYSILVYGDQDHGQQRPHPGFNVYKHQDHGSKIPTPSTPSRIESPHIHHIDPKNEATAADQEVTKLTEESAKPSNDEFWMNPELPRPSIITDENAIIDWEISESRIMELVAITTVVNANYTFADGN